MPHESVLDSLASTFTPFDPDWDTSDPDIYQSTYFLDRCLAGAAQPEGSPIALVAF